MPNKIVTLGKMYYYGAYREGEKESRAKKRRLWPL